MLGVGQRNSLALTCRTQRLSGIPGKNSSLSLRWFLMMSLKGTKAAIFSWQEKEGLAFNEANRFFKRERERSLLHPCRCLPRRKKANLSGLPFVKHSCELQACCFDERMANV